MKVLPENILRRMDAKDRRAWPHWRTQEEIQQKNILTSEKTLQRQVYNLLSQRGIWVGWSKFGRKSTYTAGAPDFLFVWQSRPFAFECKVGKEQPTPDQLECHCKMRRDGWLVFVVRTLQEARDFLDGRPQVIK